MKSAFCPRLDGDTVTTGIEVPKAARGGHVVLFYRDEEELAGSVSEFLVPAVTDGDGTAIVIATPDHRRSFEERRPGQRGHRGRGDVERAGRPAPVLTALRLPGPARDVQPLPRRPDRGVPHPHRGHRQPARARTGRSARLAIRPPGQVSAARGSS